MSWQVYLKGNPLPWLLEENCPPVRYFTLRELLNYPADDPLVVETRSTVMNYPPIRAILDAQYPAGYWVKPGPGYSPKYRSTVWQIILLEQMGADGCHPQVQRGCDYVLEHAQAKNGGFGASGSATASRPPVTRVYHCLNGNLVRALWGLGCAGDERLTSAITWQVQAILGEDGVEYPHAGSTGPGFACSVNADQPCAWGAIKALQGLARLPADQRSPQVVAALRVGAEFLLSRDPVQADYPAGDGQISPLWFRLGFPLTYVADVLENVEVLTRLGYARDERLKPAIEWLLARQDGGRWRNRNAYAGRLWATIERRGAPSKWVTLRALRVLKAAVE
ncbi:MAG TPA: nitrogen fixation protein NifH [Chloroflexi bacterium]|nr:nitrogen fixation protein NifH [Chloroflexota bacterium]